MSEQDRTAVRPGGHVVGAGDEVLPGYRVVALLSRGHRLDVYDVWSESRATRCVVKVVLPERRDESAVVADLVREGELLQQLDHPHWVRAYDVVTEPVPAVVLETLGGTTLAAMLDAERRLRPADAVLLGAQVGAALRYLHRLDWLHLDLTPTNVVVEAGRARLIDLSLAARPGPVRPGAGTTGYRAPELRVGGPVSTASDVWGLGTLLRESLCGSAPSTDDEWDDASARWPPRRLGRAPVPTWLVELVDACRAATPAHRPTLDTFLTALDQRVV